MKKGYLTLTISETLTETFYHQKPEINLKNGICQKQFNSLIVISETLTNTCILNLCCEYFYNF